MSNIAAAKGSTKTAGPSRGEFLAKAMDDAAARYRDEHNAAWEKWSKRKTQDDGTPAPTLDHKEMVARKIAARTKAKADYTALVNKT